jgi:hypothetical protein
MLATRWPSTRCTYHPALMASSAAGSLRSQCQHRPLPVEQIACRAPLTSRSEVLLALTSLMLASCCLHFHSVTLLESGRNRQPLRGRCPRLLFHSPLGIRGNHHPQRYSRTRHSAQGNLESIGLRAGPLLRKGKYSSRSAPSWPRPGGASYSSRGQRPRRTWPNKPPTLKGSHLSSRPNIALVILNAVFV